jgi:hypothetical protein
MTISRVTDVDTRSSIARANADAARVAGSLRFVLAVATLDIAAAGVAFAVAHAKHSSGSLYVLVAIAAAGLGTIAAVGIVWLFQLLRAPVRQRNEARAMIAELTAVAPFPDVAIEIENFRDDWQDHAGNRILDASTGRVWFPVVATNREESRRVSLRFDVTINAPDGNGVLFPHLRTEQHDDLPLVVDPQDSKRIELSVFLNEYVTDRLRIDRSVGRLVRYEMNTDLFRLNVFDLLSRKRIEMRLPGFYPREPPPKEEEEEQEPAAD